MIAQLCKLIWNRKRTNLLLIGELGLSFLVLTPLVAGGVLFVTEQLQPLGFDHENVWSVMYMDRDLFDEEDSKKAHEEHRNNLEVVHRLLQEFDEVQVVALSSSAPLRFSQSWNGIASVRIADEGREVLGLQLLKGRWFQPDDEALDWTPAIIDQELSRELFGDEEPLDKTVGDQSVFGDEGDRGSISYHFPSSVRVVGVVENCFYYGHFADLNIPGFIFLPLDKKQEFATSNTSYYLIKVHPGTGTAFVEKVMSKLKTVLPAAESVGFEVKQLEQLRNDSRINRLQMLGFMAVIGGLMMFMVALGLIGVVWQNVRRRTREIGLRRAVGASRGRIYGQFLGELVVMTTAAIALGCAPIVQFDLLDLILWGRVPLTVTACGIALAAMTLYLLVLLCGLYPSWLASRVQPAEALHYE